MTNQTLTKLSAKMVNLPEVYSQCGFSTFNVNSKNELYYKTCRNFDRHKNYILTGVSQAGKTHLGVSILKNQPEIYRDEGDAKSWKEILERELNYNFDNKEYIQNLLESGMWKFRQAVCFFLPFVDFVVMNSEPLYNVRKMIEYDSLIIDDFYLQMKDQILDQIYYLIEARHRMRKQTVITTRFSFDEIHVKLKTLATKLYDISEILYFREKYERT